MHLKTKGQDIIIAGTLARKHCRNKKVSTQPGRIALLMLHANETWFFFSSGLSITDICLFDTIGKALIRASTPVTVFVTNMVGNWSKLT